MPQKVLFLTTSHSYDDDRIFYHQALELKNAGYAVKISSLSSEFVGIIDGIEVESYSILDKKVNEKIKKMLDIGTNYGADIIICSEPLAVIAANKIRKRKKCSIIYDITEWYPSMSMLRNTAFFLKPIKFLQFLSVHILAGFLTTHFIFGEKEKMQLLTTLFPLKKKLILPYYPSSKYVEENINKIGNKITLCFTGAISEEKGINRFFNVLEELQRRNIGQYSVLLIGSPVNKKEEKNLEQHLLAFKEVDIQIQKPTSFQDFSKALAKADICFDLRSLNFENHHSLPIKIFYYMGSGKPIVYSKLKAIENHLNVSNFGFLVNPDDVEAIVNIIANYHFNTSLYDEHAQNARNTYLENYTWENINFSFVNFVSNSLDI